MKVTSVSISVKRSIRHRPYVVSQCECTLNAELDKEDDLGEAYKSLHSDVLFIVEEMIDKEKKDHENNRTF